MQILQKSNDLVELDKKFGHMQRDVRGLKSNGNKMRYKLMYCDLYRKIARTHKVEFISPFGSDRWRLRPELFDNFLAA